jgi:hypothetical protein
MLGTFLFLQGVLLLQQSGAMSECVSYMYGRYKKKLQVLLRGEQW